MNSLLKFISKLNVAMGVTSFLAMCAVVFYQVIMRYFFNNAQPWPEELGRYLFLICTYSSICLCVETKDHLRVEILPVCFPQLQKFFELLSSISTVLFFSGSVYLLWNMMCRVKRMGTLALTMPIPMWMLWAAIIVFCVCSFLLGMKHFAASAKALKK